MPRAKSKVKSQKSKVIGEPVVVKPSFAEATEGEDKLDPEEEKMLDWILKGVVWFVLGWLGLSVLLVIGGYFGLWR